MFIFVEMTIWDETYSGKIKNLFKILDARVSSTGQDKSSPYPLQRGTTHPSRERDNTYVKYNITC